MRVPSRLVEDKQARGELLVLVLSIVVTALAIGGLIANATLLDPPGMIR